MDWDINWEDKAILIVEDDQVNFSYMDVLLRPTRARILHAREGEEAVKICMANPDINLVLMDIRLPGMNGLDATRHIVTNRKALPVIAQTAYAEPEDQRAAYDAGCRDFLAKPIRANDMIDMIRKYL